MMLLDPFISFPAGGGGGGLPAGATAQLDFVNGFYYAGGATRAVGAVLGGGFDPGSISASGMFYDFTGTNLPKAIGPFLSDLVAGLTAGCTLVFDMDLVNPPYGFIMFLGDNTDWNTSVDGVEIHSSRAMIDDAALTLGASLSTTGPHKLAVTLNRSVGGGNYEYAWCLDGASALTQTVGYAASWTINSVHIGSDGTGAGQELDNAYIKSITLYPAKLPTDLPALTT